MSQWAFPGLAKVRRLPDELSHDLRLDGLVQLAVDNSDFGDYPREVVRALLLTGYTDACCQVAKSHDDAFVSRAGLLRWMSEAVIDALARPLGDEHPGVLHRRGDVCHCLEDREWPPASVAQYAVHNFLSVNGTKREKNLKTLKRKELSVFRAEVFRRDRFMCRTCLEMPGSLDDHRSPKALTLGHLDPNQAGGVDLLITQCKACNLKQASYSLDQKFMELYAAPSTPARTFDEAMATAEQTRAEMRAAPRPVMPGHGLPLAASVSPRPAGQVDPWNRAQIPTPPPAEPPPPDPIQNRSEPDPDRVPDPVPTGNDPMPETDPESGLDRVGQPERAADAPPDSGYLDREGEGPAGGDEPPALTPGLKRLLLSMPRGEPMPTWEIAQLHGFTAKQTEEGLRRLAAHQLVQRVPSNAGQPVTWLRL